MIVTYLRSSSIGAYQFCPARYMFEYLLGVPGTSNKKANKGNVCHKVMEACCLYKLAKDKGEKTYDLPEIGQFSTQKEIDLPKLTELAYVHYKSLAPYNDWKDSDLPECLEWVNTTLQWGNGDLNPLNYEIFGVEQFFDLTIFEDWAHYEYKDPAGGPPIEGYLGIKGNIDFIIKRSESHLTLIDWKFGARKDWGANPPKYKEYKDLVNDNQLLLYSYAMNQLFPQYEFDQTIFYVLDGGPVSIPRGEADFEKAKLMLRRYFEKIKNNKLPQKNVTFKCKKWCHYGMNNYPGTEESICDHIHGNMLEQGLHQIMLDYGKPGYYTTYAAGGGRQQNE